MTPTPPKANRKERENGIEAQHTKAGSIVMTSTSLPEQGDYSTLPREKMRKVSIAFDVDGTLRCNCTDTCEDPNPDIVEMFKILKRFKNVELYVWSGGGAEYAYRFATKFSLLVSPSRCISKFNGFKPDIAIDDIQDTALGAINLIVREK